MSKKELVECPNCSSEHTKHYEKYKCTCGQQYCRYCFDNDTFICVLCEKRSCNDCGDEEIYQVNLLGDLLEYIIDENHISRYQICSDCLKKIIAEDNRIKEEAAKFIASLSKKKKIKIPKLFRIGEDHD